MNKNIIMAACLLLAPAAGAQSKLTLAEALAQTAKQSPDTQMARLRVLETAEREVQTRSAYLPQANLVVGGTYQTTNLQGIGLIFPGFPNRMGPFRTFNARPVVTQTVLDASLLAAIRAVREQKREAEEQVRVVRDTTQMAVVELYLQALEADSRRQAAEARVQTARQLWQQTREKEAAGTSNKLDVARAEQQWEAEQGLVLAAQRDADVLRTLLRQTIGLETGEFVLDAASLRMPDAAQKPRLEVALAARPEMAMMAARKSGATWEKKAAERERWPKLGATGDYGVLGAGPDQSLSTYNVGATLTIPLWTGRRIESQIAAAKVRVSQAEEETRRMRLRIAQEVREASIELDNSQRNLQSAERGRKAAQEALELAQLRYGAGLATTLDTTAAQGQLAEAEDREIRARYALARAGAKAARSEGRLEEFVR
jgi:outer membrane protein TolC